MDMRKRAEELMRDEQGVGVIELVLILVGIFTP